MRFGLLRILLAVMAFSVVSASVLAAPVVWTLNGVTFDDGGTASGSFTYDENTNTFSAVNITTTNGSSRTGATYTFVSSGFAPSSSGVLSVTTGAADQTGLPGFALFFSPELSNAGGNRSLFFSQEADCADPGCVGPAGSSRFVTAGIVSAPAIAIPTLSEWSFIALSILLAGTGAVSLRRFRKRS